MARPKIILTAFSGVLVLSALLWTSGSVKATSNLPDDTTSAAVQTLVPTPTPTASAANINPLTGLPVSNPKNLSLPPALVSMTNWPRTARPQAGLSFSPLVYELYIGEGMTRFLAMFYGEYPAFDSTVVQGGSSANNSGNSSGGSSTGGTTSVTPQSTGKPALSSDAAVGPIRSGRLPYQHVRSIYSGFLVMASAYAGVAQNLSGATNIYGSDADNINSAMIKVTQIEAIAHSQQSTTGPVNLTGMTFDAQVPAGGLAADRFWFFYNELDQVIWNYNVSGGVYQRYQFTAEENNRFIQSTDRLNGKTLDYSNVVVLFANHRACTETAFDVDLMYIKRSPALLFRDGKVYKIYWTTRNEDYEKTTGKLRPIRFIDEQGNPFPLKPGQTWIHLVPLSTPSWETVNSPVLDDMLSEKQASTQPGTLYNMVRQKQANSGVWAMRYVASMMVQDPEVCKQLVTKK